MATFFVRTAGGSLGTAATYSLTSPSGAASATLPTLADDILLTTGSGNVTSGNVTFRNLTYDAGYTGTHTGASSTTLTMHGNLSIAAGRTFATPSGTLNCASGATQTLDANNNAVPWLLNASVANTTISLLSAYRSTGNDINIQSISNVTFRSNGHAVTCRAFVSTGTATRVVDLTGSTVTTLGTGTVWNISGSNLTMPGLTTTTIVLGGTSGVASTFIGGGFTYGEIIQSSPGVLTLSGTSLACSIFRSQPSVPNGGTDLVLPSPTGLTCTDFYAVPYSREARLMVRSSSPGSSVPLTVTGSARLNDTSFMDVDFQGAAWANANGGPNLISDSFTDRTALLDDYRTPSGATWQQEGAVWRTDSQGAYSESATGTVLTLNGRVLDGTVQATVFLNGGGTSVSLAQRARDVSFLVRASIGPTTTTIFSVSGGVATTLATVSRTHVDGTVYRFSAVGDTFTLFADNVQLLQATSRTSLRGFTRVGLFTFGGTSGTARIRDFSFTPAVTPVPPLRVGDGQGNTNVPAGLMQPSRSLYIQGSGNSDLANVYFVDGETVAGDGPPLPQDDLRLAAGVTRLTLATTYLCRNLTIESGDIFANSAPGDGARIFGNLTLAATANATAVAGAGVTRSIQLAGRGTHTITSNGKTISIGLTIQNPGGKYVLQDALLCSGKVFVTSNATRNDLDCNNQNLTAGSLEVYGGTGGASGIDWGTSGTTTLTGTGQVFLTSSLSGRTVFLNNSKPRLVVSNATTTAKSIALNRSDIYPLASLSWVGDLDVIGGNNSLGNVIVKGGNSVTLAPSITWTVDAFTPDGSTPPSHAAPFYLGAAPLNSNVSTHTRGQTTITAPAGTLSHYFISSVAFTNPTTVHDGMASNTSNTTLSGQSFPYVRDAQSRWATRASIATVEESVDRPACAAGDVMIVWAQCGVTSGNPTVTGNPGASFTELASGGSGATTFRVWAKTITDPNAEPATYSVAITSTATTLHANAVAALSVGGASGLGAISTLVSNTGQSSVVWNTSATTTGPDRLVLRLVGASGANNHTMSPGPASIEVLDHVRSGTNSALMAAYAQAQPVAGATANYTATSSGNVSPNRITLTFQPVAGSVPVTATRTSTWTTRAAAATTRASTWHVRLAVTPSTRTSTWTALSTPVGTRASTWATRTATPASRSSTWATRTATASDARATSWTTRATPAPTSRTSSWHTRTAPAASRASLWACRATTLTSRASGWQTRAPLTTTRGSVWAAGAGAAAARSTLWAVLTSAATGLFGFHDGTGWVGKPLLEWTGTAWTVRPALEWRDGAWRETN